MFHYFAANDDVMEQIKEKFEICKQNNQVSEQDSALPLQIINPDDDGNTAIFLALTNQSPKSFECMIEMMADFPDLCISKMLLKSYSEICENESDGVINFFEDGGIFQPPQMRIQQFVPWRKDMEEIIFSSHTAMISIDLLHEKLEEEGVFLKKDDESEKDVKSAEHHEHGISPAEKIMR